MCAACLGFVCAFLPVVVPWLRGLLVCFAAAVREAATNLGLPGGHLRSRLLLFSVFSVGFVPSVLSVYACLSLLRMLRCATGGLPFAINAIPEPHRRCTSRTQPRCARTAAFRCLYLPVCFLSLCFVCFVCLVDLHCTLLLRVLRLPLAGWGNWQRGPVSCSTVPVTAPLFVLGCMKSPSTWCARLNT